MNNDAWFRINTIIPMAIELTDEPPPAVLQRGSFRSKTDHARAAVGRISSWDYPEIKEVCAALIDAITEIEKDLKHLTRSRQLETFNIDLNPQLIAIGGDGIALNTGLPYAHSSRLRVWLELSVRGGVHLWCASAVLKQTEGERSELLFSNLAPENRDQLIAFVFEQQGKERRLARNSSPQS